LILVIKLLITFVNLSIIKFVRMKLLKYIFITSILLVALQGVSQEQKSYSSFFDKLQWGGNLGLSFGTRTYIQVAPVLYYEVVDDLILGAGIDYTYFKDKGYHNYYIEGHSWSPRIFARYFLLDDFFIHAEYQQYYYKNNYSNQAYTSDWMWSEPGYFAGGGYRQWMGQNSYMFVMLLFDLQETELNFGINPRIQMGFAAGF